MDFIINFHIDCLSLELTGNKGDTFGNSKLMSFGFENQGFQILKENKMINTIKKRENRKGKTYTLKWTATNLSKVKQLN